LSGWRDVDYADELFFEGFDVADQDFWLRSDAHGKGEECAVGADVGGEGVFGDVLIVCAAADDKDGRRRRSAGCGVDWESERGWRREWSRGDGLRDKCWRKREEVKRLEVYVPERKGWSVSFHIRFEGGQLFRHAYVFFRRGAYVPCWLVAASGDHPVRTPRVVAAGPKLVSAIGLYWRSCTRKSGGEFDSIA